MRDVTSPQKSPFLRRSPRLQSSTNTPVVADQCETTRRLAFTPADSFENGAVSNASVQQERAVRQVQLHQSEELILVPSSVDPGAGALQTFTESASEQVGVPDLTEIDPGAILHPRDGQELSFNEQDRSAANDQDVPTRRGSPCGAMVLPEDDEDQNLRASHGNEKSGVYTFLYRMSVKDLRKLSKCMKLRQQGNKGELVARILVSVDIRLAGGESLSRIMELYDSTARYGSWVQHQRALDERVPQYWSVAPSLQQLLSKLGNREVEQFKKRKLAVLRTREDPDAIVGAPQQALQTARPSSRNLQEVRNAVSNINFSISEFARLCIIIRDDEDAKAALFATGQELTRSQMDAGFSRESFWGVIEGRFNDPGLRLCLSMVGNVDEVDSAQPPPCHRSASFLKERFFDARSSFTLCVENWSRSGQNETSNFKSFAGIRSGELTASGKRNMVLFVCARMGTENEDCRFRSMCMRTIPHGGGVDEGGSEAPLERASSAQAPESSRLRRGSLRNSGGDNDSVDQSVVQLSQYILERGRQRLISDEEKREERRERRQQRREHHEEERQRATERRESRKRNSGDSCGLRQLEENHKLIKLLRYTTETLKSQGQDAGPELVVAARRQHEAIFRAFKMPQNSLEGLQGDISMSDDYEHRNQIARDGHRGDNASDENRRDDRNTPEGGNDDDEILPNV